MPNSRRFADKVRGENADEIEVTADNLFDCFEAAEKGMAGEEGEERVRQLYGLCPHHIAAPEGRICAATVRRPFSDRR